MMMEAIGCSDVGRKREANEDSFLVLDLSGRTPGAEFEWLLAVADGIGGHIGGAQASEAAVRILAEAFPPGGTSPAREALLEAIRRANSEIFRLAAGIPDSAGMGTTLVAALVRPGYAFIANVGDSRAYVVRRRRLYQVTRDHSWVAEQRASGGMSEDDLARSPFRRMVTRSLGYETSVRADAFEVDLDKRDTLLLCSDGLYGPVTEKELGRRFRRRRSLAKLCTGLVRLANRRGGPDNITAVAARNRGSS